MAHRSSLFYFDSAEKYVKRGILTIYTNHPSENLVQKHKTIKFDLVGELPTKKYTQNKVSPRRRIHKSAEQTKKSRKIASTQITGHVSLASQTKWSEPFDFPTGFLFSLCKWQVPLGFL